MAGNECFEVPGCLDTENILFEEGMAFRLPLKVKVTSPWLEKLGSGPCYIGSDENPIHINLTTEGAGRRGEPRLQRSIHQHLPARQQAGGLRLAHPEEASGPKGCGGAYESYVDKALNCAEANTRNGAELAKTGIVVLQGNLHDAAKADAVLAEGVESGELP